MPKLSNLLRDFPDPPVQAYARQLAQQHPAIAHQLLLTSCQLANIQGIQVTALGDLLIGKTTSQGERIEAVDQLCQRFQDELADWIKT